MKKNRFFKLFCFVSILLPLFFGCNKRDERNALLTSMPSITPTEGVTTPTIDTVRNTEDNMTTEEPLNETNEIALCNKDEDVLFSFQIAASDKIASICIAKQNSEYIIYRYGKPNDIELEYPEKKESSWDEFTYSYYFRGGGTDNAGMDLNYLSFENEEYNYEVYEEYISEADETLVGITVTNRKTGEETNIQGDSNNIKGSLISLRNNDKINIIVQ